MFDVLDLKKAEDNLKKAGSNIKRLFGKTEVKVEDVNYLHKIIESMNPGDSIVIKKDFKGKVVLKVEQSFGVK